MAGMRQGRKGRQPWSGWRRVRSQAAGLTVRMRQQAAALMQTRMQGQRVTRKQSSVRRMLTR
jgi:hypothetical protein